MGEKIGAQHIEAERDQAPVRPVPAPGDGIDEPAQRHPEQRVEGARPEDDPVGGIVQAVEEIPAELPDLGLPPVDRIARKGRAQQQRGQAEEPLREDAVFRL